MTCPRAICIKCRFHLLVLKGSNSGRWPRNLHFNKHPQELLSRGGLAALGEMSAKALGHYCPTVRSLESAVPPSFLGIPLACCGFRLGSSQSVPCPQPLQLSRPGVSFFLFLFPDLTGMLSPFFQKVSSLLASTWTFRTPQTVVQHWVNSARPGVFIFKPFLESLHPAATSFAFLKWF